MMLHLTRVKPETDPGSSGLWYNLAGYQESERVRRQTMNTHTSRVCVNLSNTPTAMLGTKFSLSKKNLRFGDMTAFFKVKPQNQSKNLGL